MPLPYTQTYPGGWQDGPAGGTPMTAAALNAIENELVALDAAVLTPYTIEDFAATSYTAVAGDVRKFKRSTATASVAVALPNSIAAGRFIDFEQGNTGVITFSATTLQSRGNMYRTAGQYAVVRAISLGGNVWLLTGDRQV